MNISTLYSVFQECSRICTDSRSITEGCLFVALKGPTFNGNDFVEQALKSGASYAIADEERDAFNNNNRVIVVKDALVSLQELAKYHRSKLKIPIIGVTGSNGKTTSKELLGAALGTVYSTYATKGNLNNHIGVPLSILEIDLKHEIAIIEMGANHRGEIASLCTIARPDYGFITNIGLAHLEGFGSEEGIYLGKKELFDYIEAENGNAFVNSDDPKVVQASQNLKATTYGSLPGCHFQGSYRLTNGYLSVTWWRDIDPFGREIKTNLSGAYNFSNVMSSIAIARYFGVPDTKIAKGIEAYHPKNNRSQIEKTSLDNVVIVDCYNANPSSMSAAIANLVLHEHPQKIAIVGDMLEVGDASQDEHCKVLSQLNNAGIQTIAIGDAFKSAIEVSAFGQPFDTTDEAMAYIKAHPLSNAMILLKGSRKMKLERLLELL